MDKRNLSYEEIIEQYHSDICRGFAKEYYELCEKYTLASKRPRSKERYYYPANRFHTYMYDFNYVVNFFIRGKDEPEFDNFGDLVYAWFWKDGERYAITFQHDPDNPMNFHYSIYIPHFFKRYKQRFLKTRQMSDLDVMNHYFLNNWRQAFKNVPSIKYPNCVYQIGNDGVCFSNNINNRYFEYKTYITWDMLFKDQKKIALEAKLSADAHGFDLALPEDEFDEIYLIPNRIK